METIGFNPAAYKETTRQQWDSAAESWHRWGPTIGAWMGGATKLMLDMADVGEGSRVLEAAFTKAGFHDVRISVVSAPLRMSSAAECVRFERESFGALHQMLSDVDATEREAIRVEIEHELRQFEGTGGFEGPCEMVVGVATK